jgi:hypothetical protein
MATDEFHGYSPLYERIAEIVSLDAEMLAFVRETPPEAHLPQVLLAAVHYLLLGGLDHPLAEVYAGRSTADPAPLFREVCLDHRDELLSLLAMRRVQTNDCGRSALLGLGMTWLAERLPGRLALVDVGASAGLNLIADRYRLDYGARGAVGPASSPVRIRCEVVGGRPPIAPTLPSFVSRTGLDRSPVDLSDEDDARWLLACVWPDTGRLERTAASIRLAQEALPVVRRRDAVGDLPSVLDELESGVGAIVMNSWSLSYLGRDERQQYFGVLAEASRHRPIGWLVADGGSVVAELPGLSDAEAGVHTLGTVVFGGGEGSAAGRLLAGVHQHGMWVDWKAEPG